MCVLQVVQGGAHTQQLVQAISFMQRKNPVDRNQRFDSWNEQTCKWCTPQISRKAYQGALLIQNAIFTEQA